MLKVGAFGLGDLLDPNNFRLRNSDVGCDIRCQSLKVFRAGNEIGVSGYFY